MMTEKTRLWLTNCWVFIPYSINRNSSLKYDTRRLLKMAGTTEYFYKIQNNGNSENKHSHNAHNPGGGRGAIHST